MLSLNWLNASAEMMAPALPEAADTPCAVARNRVGKTSAGYIYPNSKVNGVRANIGVLVTYVCRRVGAEIKEELIEGIELR